MLIYVCMCHMHVSQWPSTHVAVRGQLADLSPSTTWFQGIQLGSSGKHLYSFAQDFFLGLFVLF